MKTIFTCKQNEAGDLVYQFPNGAEYTLVSPEETEGKIFFEVCNERYCFGVADINGEIIIPCEEGDMRTVATNGKVYVQRYDIHKEKWGVIDSNQKITIPFEYDTVDWMDIISDDIDGKLAFRFGKNDKWGLINLEGNIILPVEYDNIYIYRDPSGDKLAIRKNDKWGVADSKGEIIIPIEHEYPDGFMNSIIENDFGEEY